jgi:hypothetical protein
MTFLRKLSQNFDKNLQADLLLTAYIFTHLGLIEADTLKPSLDTEETINTLMDDLMLE